MELVRSVTFSRSKIRGKCCQPRGSACECIARRMIEQKSAKVPEDHLVAVLQLAQASWNANAIMIEIRHITATSIYRSTIDHHILCAKSMGLEISASRLEVTPSIRTT
ncbi:hypothetical protein AB0H00_25990 [Nocardia sp. NPDC023852]|uniref:hypothetical protein n=1 Tax=Nocardia sp. NPDC023852 TaxID=3154697 RepID=UPI003410B4DC